MRTIVLVILAIAAVLSGAPSPASASATRDTPGRPAAEPAGQPASPPAGLSFEPLEIALGIGGIGALALFAGYLLLERRRRVGAKSSERRDDTPARPTSAEEQATAALQRRTLRRGRMRLEEDPIIASMGVGSTTRSEPGISRARRAQRSSRRSPRT